MSLGLVAYGSSDESDTSDNEEATEQIVSQKGDTGESTNRVDNDSGKAQSSETKDLVNTEKTNTEQGLGLKLPPPKHAVENNSLLSSLPNVKTSESVETTQDLNSKPLTGPRFEELDVPKKSTTLLAGLPAPKLTVDTRLIDENEDELEDEVKPKPSQMTGPSIPPAKNKKPRQPVKISIPSLPDPDSDEDEDTNKRKPKGTAGGKHGLFSLLPAPKHAATKETNRVLIPYSLSKKSTQTAVKKTPDTRTQNSQKKSVPSSTIPSVVHAGKPAAKLPGIPDDDSEDEEESASNFFSLGEEKTSATFTPSAALTDKGVAPAVATTVVPPSINKPELPALRGPWQGPAAGPTLLSNSSTDTMVSIGANRVSNEPLTFAQPEHGDLQDAPLTFKKSTQSYISGPQVPPMGFQQDITGFGPQNTAPQHSYTHQTQYEEAQAEASTSDLQQYLKDEEFLKMQGKRGRRMEEINIVDVNAGDQTSEVDLMKNLTEEVAAQSSSRKRKGLPSSQQRRKHQITYLAYQAKEREIELKNQWAQNRQTRRQTQSKYGF